MNQLLPATPRAFDYLISGGDAALLLSDELPEDDPLAGARQLAELANGRATCLIGISCGLSAPYVAGQLDFALCAGAGSAAVAIGFNPAELSRDAPVGGLRSGAASFRDVARSLSLASRQGQRHALVNPVVGPEAVAGSSRMKGGSATLILADAICYRAVALHASRRKGGSPTAAPPPIALAVDKAHSAVRNTYREATSIAQVCSVLFCSVIT